MIRLLVQVIVAVAGWVIFGWLWWRALEYGPTPTHLRGTVIVLLIDLVIVVVTVMWIVWNKDIYRRKGPRTTVPAVEFAYAVDALGTPVDIRVPLGQGERFIVIDKSAEQGEPIKSFTSASALATPADEA